MSTVRLYKDIGLDPTFKKTIDFSSKTAQQTWFNSKTYKQYDNVNYNKLQNILTINEDVTFASALEYTYVVITQMEEGTTRSYYCFINNVVLNSPGRVEFELTIDPIQTFMCEFTIGESMVTRKHCDRWDSGVVPIYDTPNTDSVNANVEAYVVKDISQKITTASTTLPYLDPEKTFICVMCYTEKTKSWNTTNIVKLAFPFANVEYSKRAVYGPDYTFGGETKIIRYPDAWDILTGRLPSIFDIAPEDIVYIGVVPLISLPLTSTADTTNEINRYKFDGVVNYTVSNHEVTQITTKGSIKAYYGACQVFDKMEDATYTISVPLIQSTKPTTTSVASSIHEPALELSPYNSFTITDGIGQTKLTIPENITMNLTGTLTIRTLLGNSSLYNMLSFKADTVRAGQSGCSTMIEANYMDVFNDAWLTYSLTQKDTDRQLVSNSNIQSAIDNLIFMSYGGALVGSRSASGIKDSDVKRNKLLASGVAKAVPLAAGSSVLSSLVDSHYAWEAQKLKETKIKNQPSNLLIIGNGSALINGDTLRYKICRVQCDDINLKRAYDNFRKYGYEITRFEKPNIKSRKYFDYILTNGAVIEGSLNADTKKAIATIFDSGITIFHGDYSTTLEYPTLENIERSLM